MGELLSMSGVSKGYWRGQHWLAVLEAASLEVDAGEVVAVVGARDEGKTTLLKLAAAMERPEEGCVRLGDRDLAVLSAQDRERLLGHEVVWLDRRRPGFGWTACEYVELPLTLGRGRGRRGARRQAQSALERFGVGRCAERRWEELSNWERVLVALARAFAARARLVLIDDLLDGFGTLRTQDAGDQVRLLVEEVGCGVLMSASGLEATVIADSVWSFGRRRLVPLAGPAGPGAEVIDFPGEASPRTGSRGVGR